MALVDVSIKVATEMEVYLKPYAQVTELERNALLLMKIMFGGKCEKLEKFFTDDE